MGVFGSVEGGFHEEARIRSARETAARNVDGEQIPLVLLELPPLECLQLFSVYRVIFLIKICSLCKLFLLGFVIEGFHAQNEKNKQIDVKEIKDLCNKVFVCIYTVYI